MLWATGNPSLALGGVGDDHGTRLLPPGQVHPCAQAMVEAAPLAPETTLALALEPQTPQGPVPVAGGVPTEEGPAAVADLGSSKKIVQGHIVCNLEKK